ncbi:MULTISPECIES: cell division protein ZapA [unclassified Devosia]|uniref:cell division protein ZapA n=1 Tax=unclassified Devosia TaxID=196773 RepID=UPI000FD8F16A|nr:MULTISPECIES: cell division protein ZapA [unclassified Devosia]
MPEVNVEINGRRYRMACEEGQQKHLIGLAKRFDGEVDAIKGVVGEIGDTRLTVMAGIAVVDELAEAEKRIAALQAEIEQLSAAGQQIAGEMDALEQRFAGKLEQAARSLEIVAGVLDETAVGPQK